MDEVRPFLAGLVQRKCDVIIAAGANQTNALVGEPGEDSGIVFVAVSEKPFLNLVRGAACRGADVENSW